MGDADQIDTPSEEDIQSRFAQVLERHLTPGGEPTRFLLGPVVLAGGVLLVERELEVTDGVVGPSDRYTEETLVESLDDMGVNANGAVARAISEMTKSGFVQVTDGGQLIAQPALTAFKEQLDAAFPRMQGLNLVAYLIQTVDEVMSGRKGLDAALEQLGQTLALQKADSTPAGQKGASVSGKNGPSGPGKKRANAQTLKSALSRRLRRRETGSAPAGHPRMGDPVVFSAGGGGAPAQVKPVLPQGPKIPSEEVKEPDQTRVESELQPPETWPASGRELVDETLSAPHRRQEDDGISTFDEKEDSLDLLPASGHELVDETLPDPPRREEDDVIPTSDEEADIPETASPPVPDAEPDGPDLNEPVADSSEGPENGEADEEVVARPERPPAYQNDPVEIPDDSASNRSLRMSARETGSDATTRQLKSHHATWEKTVPPLPDDPSVMPCPVCDAGGIREQKTEKARTYFTCSNPDCVFVSWGRPHARVCPSCGNPYLVEATGKGGEPVLTCPRATCRYRQPMSGKGLTDPPATLPSGPPTPGAKKPTRSAKRVVRRRVIRKKH